MAGKLSLALLFLVMVLSAQQPPVQGGGRAGAGRGGGRGGPGTGGAQGAGGKTGGQPGGQPDGPPKQPGSMEGAVTDAVTHHFIRKATVMVMSLSGGHSYTGVSGEEGKFVIANVEPGTYLLSRAEAQGYSWVLPSRTAASNAVLLAEGQKVTGLKVEMQPFGVISGKVLDEDGEPMRDVQVSAKVSDYSQGVRLLRNQGSATTNDQGEYRLFDLPAGRYYVRISPAASNYQSQGRIQAEPPLPNTHRDAAETGYPAQYFPDASDASQATSSAVAPGKETPGVNFKLRRVPVYSIRGKSDGTNPVVATPCSTNDTNDNSTLVAVKRQDGYFEFNALPPAVYCLSLANNGPNAQIYAQQVVSITDQSVENVTLAPLPIVPTQGTVDFETPPTTQTPNLMVAAQSLSPITRNGNGQVKDGAFSLGNLTPGKYQVTVRGNQGIYVKSIRYGNEDVTDGIVNLRADGTALKIVAASDMGQLDGTVQTGNSDPAVDVQLTVAPANLLSNRRDLIKTTSTDHAGHFSIRGLAPGDYRIYAWDDSSTGGQAFTATTSLAISPDFRKEFSNFTTVTITPGGKATVQVNLIPASEIQQVKSKFQ